jgi:hypothetical protein
MTLGLDARAVRLRTAFLAARRAGLFREDDALARLATARLRPFVLFFARRLTLRRARFAMMEFLSSP